MSKVKFVLALSAVALVMLIPTTTLPSTGGTKAQYSLEYAPHPMKKTVIKVLAPEGITGRIYDRGKLLYEDEIPFSFVAKPDVFYKIEVLCPGGKWSRKVEARAGQVARLKVSCAKAMPSDTSGISIRIQIDQPQQPVETPAETGAHDAPMTEAQFAKLKRALEAEAFEDGKLELLKDAAAQHRFTSEQVAEIMDLFDFDANRVEAAVICYPKVVDKQNFFVVYSHLEFDASKDELRQKIKKMKGD